ncbi:MAG: hypothetical protein M3Z25_22240 [Actinomycetota bacterium]|nr:hypothetical protein [Actinomycetota bacterium]
MFEIPVFRSVGNASSGSWAAEPIERTVALISSVAVSGTPTTEQAPRATMPVAALPDVELSLSVAPELEPE